MIQKFTGLSKKKKRHVFTFFFQSVPTKELSRLSISDIIPVKELLELLDTYVKGRLSKNNYTLDIELEINPSSLLVEFSLSEKSSTVSFYFGVEGLNSPTFKRLKSDSRYQSTRTYGIEKKK